MVDLAGPSRGITRRGARVIVATADVGGTNIAVAITRDDERIGFVRGAGSPVRPGRGLLTAAAVSELVRSAMAQADVRQVDAVVVGAAGAGRAEDSAEVRAALVRERIATTVIVVTDALLALEALGAEVGAVLVAGTGSVVLGRTGNGQLVKRGGLGWQMGDEGGGYWIGREALVAVGRAAEGRGPSTTLGEKVYRLTSVANVRELAGWSTTATAREVASLTAAVVAAARDRDAVAVGIVAQAAELLANLANSLGKEFPEPRVPLGLAGGLLTSDGLVREQVVAQIRPPFRVADRLIDPLLGGPRLAQRR